MNKIKIFFVLLILPGSSVNIPTNGGIKKPEANDEIIKMLTSNNFAIDR